MRAASPSQAIEAAFGRLHKGGRAASGAEPQNHCESKHGETGNGNPFWGLKAKRRVWPFHGGFEGRFTGNRHRSTALPNHGTFPSSGPPNRVRYWTGMHTLAAATV